MGALPKQVQQKIAEGERIAKELYSSDGEPKEPEEPKAPAPEGQKGGDPLSDSAPESAQGGTPPAEPPAAPKSPSPKAEPAQPASPPSGEGEGGDFQHKYQVLQGKYNKEVPRLQQENRELASTLQELRQRLTNTETLLASLKQQGEAPKQEPKKPLISEKEIEEFGPDLVDLMRRVAQMTAEEQLAAFGKQLTPRFQQLEQRASTAANSVAKSERQKLLDSLGDAVPNWQQMNTDPEFLGWLDQRDPFSRVKRGELLRDAYEANDSESVIAFFQSFQRENAAVQDDPAPAAAAPKQETPVKEAPRRLDDYVAPGTPKTGTADAQGESGRIWTRQDIRDLYSKFEMYRKKGKPVPKELMAQEADVIKAQHEGRIRD